MNPRRRRINRLNRKKRRVNARLIELVRLARPVFDAIAPHLPVIATLMGR